MASVVPEWGSAKLHSTLNVYLLLYCKKWQLSTHPQVVPNLDDFLSSLKHKKYILRNVSNDFVHKMKVTRVQNNTGPFFHCFLIKKYKDIFQNLFFFVFHRRKTQWKVSKHFNTILSFYSLFSFHVLFYLKLSISQRPVTTASVPAVLLSPPAAL